MRVIVVLGWLAAIGGLPAFGQDVPASRPAIYVDHAGLLKLGWQLAAEGSTFRGRSNFEMIDLLHSLTVHHIELSAEQLPAEADVDALMAKLKSVHMDIVSIGPVDLGASEANDRKVFDLAKALRIKTIVARPADDAIDLLGKLADEYRVNVAIINGVKPAAHWDADGLLAMVSGRSKRIGVCADVAAWRQSGLSPLECAQKLRGHILEVHLSGFDDRDSGDVLKELKEDGFRGICGVGASGETDQFIRNVNAFSEIVGDLSGTR